MEMAEDPSPSNGRARASSISELMLNLHTHRSGATNQNKTIGECFLNSRCFKYGYTPSGRTIYIDGLHTNIIGEFSVDEFLNIPQSFVQSTWKFRRLIRYQIGPCIR